MWQLKYDQCFLRLGNWWRLTRACGKRRRTQPKGRCIDINTTCITAWCFPDVNQRVERHILSSIKVCSVINTLTCPLWILNDNAQIYWSDFVLRKLAGWNPGQHLFLILHLFSHVQLLWAENFRVLFPVNSEYVVRVLLSVFLVVVDRPTTKTFSHLWLYNSIIHTLTPFHLRQQSLFAVTRDHCKENTNIL